MSGGHFDYIQYRLERMADEIENDAIERDDWRIRHLSDCLRAVAKMLNAYDYYLCGDYGYETFKEEFDAYSRGCKRARGNEESD